MADQQLYLPTAESLLVASFRTFFVKRTAQGIAAFYPAVELSQRTAGCEVGKVELGKIGLAVGANNERAVGCFVVNQFGSHSV